MRFRRQSSASVEIAEQEEDQDNRQRDADEPKQTTTKHSDLQAVVGKTTAQALPRFRSSSKMLRRPFSPACGLAASRFAPSAQKGALLASPRLRGEGCRRQQACAAGEGEGRRRKGRCGAGRRLFRHRPSPPLRLAALVSAKPKPAPRKRGEAKPVSFVEMHAHASSSGRGESLALVAMCDSTSGGAGRRGLREAPLIRRQGVVVPTFGGIAAGIQRRYTCDAVEFRFARRKPQRET